MALEYQAASQTRQQALVQAGLTPHQATLYETLTQRGAMRATRLAFLAGVPRTLSYKVLEELVGLGLVVKKDEPGKVAVFVPAHPLKLKELADKRLEEAKSSRQALEGALAKLISDFNTTAGQPGVRILEGVAGVAELYEDQLNERQPILLIRSPRDNTPELNALVQEQIREQVKLSIPVRVIAPMTPGTPQKVIETDKERLVERRIVPREEFAIPAQIAIYANKVALTAYEGPLITTLIENPAIAATFRILFEYVWKMAAPGHEEILKGIYVKR